MADSAPVPTSPTKASTAGSPTSKHSKSKSPTSAKTSSPKTSSPTAAGGRDEAQDLAAAHEAETTIEADPALAGPGANDDDDDEAYGSDDSASRASTSVSSSVRDYTFENNRRYHKFREGRYHFPNDEPEQEREDMKHAMIVNLCNGRLHYAPLENPQTILDIGTGTGIWAIDMGDEYPEAEVIGIDLSPIQPAWVPPNVKFMVDDAETAWVWKPSSLDYIHIRHMTSSIRDWPTLISQAYTALKPGGWIELQELRFVLGCDDDTLKPDDPVAGFLNNIKEGLAQFGVNLLAMEKNPDNVREAGFTNVEERIFKVPLGVWPRNTKMKTVGLYNRSMIYDGLQGISMGPFTRGLKWSPEEVELYLVGIRKAVHNSGVHSYLPFHVTIGQKPA
ncbi:S-adenosyl-L-methionine-dependent methyltransferase [Coniochaeta sp. 2T2.1]|nr:S-adenosyl-L-methionine-dependent methyltransferase [Coniochaeta sp. 2T2.1]